MYELGITLTMYNVSDFMALLRELLTISQDRWFIPRSVIILGGVPRRVYKNIGAIDGPCVTPFAEPESILPREMISGGLPFTTYDDTVVAGTSDNDLSDVIEMASAFQCEMRASVANNVGSGASSMHIFAWGCVSVSLVDDKGQIRTLKALREVMADGTTTRFAAIARVASQIDFAQESEGYMDLQLWARGSAWSHGGLTDAQNGGHLGVTAARENAERMGNALVGYLSKSTAEQYVWELERGGVASGDIVVEEVLTAKLGSKRVIRPRLAD